MATNTTLGQNVVKAQQLYAAQHDVSVLFEILTVALLSSKPADPLAHLHAKLVELAAVSGPLSVPATGKNIDTEEGAARYLEEKGVHPLLEELLTLTLVAKPEHPAAFLAAECKARVDAAASGAPTPSFFTDDDLRGIHSLFDATHSGFITPVQARTALKSLGCDPAGVGSTTAPLDPATWVGIARAGLAKGKGPR